MNHLLSQVSGKKTKVFCLFLVRDELYLRLNSAITFAGESHRACHNHTQDRAARLEQQHWSDHNETAMLYLGCLAQTEHCYLALLAMSMKTDVNKSSGFCNLFWLLKIEPP